MTTRTVSIAAPPERVHAYLADPRHLPDWAPGFAESVTPERDDVWTVHTPAGARRVAVRSSGTHGVVDVVNADAPDEGLFTRVVPNPTGSELIFSLFFPEGTDPAAVDAQLAVLEQELATVRANVEALTR